jgi:DNA-binding MarR family transcriptional regulator
MSIEATLWAFNQKLPPFEKLVLILLADRHNYDDGYCEFSPAKLAQEAGMSQDVLTNTIQALRDRGLVGTQERDSDGLYPSEFSLLKLHLDQSRRLAGVPEVGRAV